MITQTETFDLGCGMTYRYMTGASGSPIGIIETHRAPGQKKTCSSHFILFDIPETRERFPGKQVWTVNSAYGKPLTLWPSILCSACGNHGFIVNGRWVPDA